MSVRVRLADRRSHETIVIRHDSEMFKIGLGRNLVGAVLGPVREVFINAARSDSMLDRLVCDGAILMSLALQAGVTAAEIAAALKRNPDGSPASPIGAAADLLKIESTEEEAG